MNSLNILSSRVSPPVSAAPSRSNSIGALSLVAPSEAKAGGAGYGSGGLNSNNGDDNNDALSMPGIADETTPLLVQKDTHAAGSHTRLSSWRSLPKRMVMALWNSIRWMLQTLTVPGAYLFACLYDEQGNFAPLGPLKHLFVRPPHRAKNRSGKAASAYYDESLDYSQEDEKSRRLSTGSESSASPFLGSGRSRASPATATSSFPAGYNSSAISSESESDFDRKGPVRGLAHSGSGSGSSSGGPRRKGAGSDGAGRRGTTGSRSGGDEDSAGGGSGGGGSGGGSRRSVRIKLNDDTLRQRKHRKGQSSSSSSMMRGGSNSSTANFAGPGGGDGVDRVPKDISAQLKSPTSPAGALTKYPRTPAPPRPLIPRRQPSYLNLEPVDRAHQKTLILDLDETLIHSMSKGGRMSTGHMVEVRLDTTFVGMGGQPSVGPQHPILYYVHKRPYCDEFLRRVCKWFNLVIFTASVQEYADPVIDWLESERKFFSARFYRQHCTYRNGAFIKDLSAVEPDLSKVMILDNSPLSYLFHQDNAIPIQGWISDHTDNDLLHLVPLLEGLQYVSDVRALLALRGGEDGRHMA